MKTLALLILMLACCMPAVSAKPLSAAETRAMIIASQRYPDLQREGTAHYKAYQELLRQSIQTRSVVFKDPNWPLLIAERARASLPATRQGPRRIGRTDIEKYEDAIARMLQSKSPEVRQYGQLEQAAHQAELAGDMERATEIRSQLAQLRALGRIESLLMQLSNDIWQIKLELGIP